MKNVLLLLITVIICIPAEAQVPVGDQKKSEDVELSFSDRDFNRNGAFHMKNINGDLRVTGYDGDEILITGKKTVWKRNGDISREEVEEVFLDYVYHNDDLYVYVQAPGVEIKMDGDQLHYRIHSDGWRKNWRDKKKADTRFEFNLVLKVPEYLMSDFSTINNGDVIVENMKNGVKANNVNGSVVLRDVSGFTDVATVNGDIDVWFARSPESDTEFNTVNGTIQIYSPKDLSTIVTFESLHGELYTDFENIERLPNRLNKEKQSTDGGFRYKIQKTSPIKIGDGGSEMSFRLVNGSVYIRQRTS